MLTEEIAEAICQKENCILDGEKEKLNLCSMELEKVLSPDSTLEQALLGIVQLERTLYMVQELYRSADRRVADHCENVQAAKRMEAVSFHDLSWIVRMVKVKFAGNSKGE